MEIATANKLSTVSPAPIPMLTFALMLSDLGDSDKGLNADVEGVAFSEEEDCSREVNTDPRIGTNLTTDVVTDALSVDIALEEEEAKKTPIVAGRTNFSAALSRQQFMFLSTSQHHESSLQCRSMRSFCQRS